MRTFTVAGAGIFSFCVLVAIIRGATPGTPPKVGRAPADSTGGVIGAVAAEGHHLMTLATNECLDWSDIIITSEPCDPKSQNQKWLFEPRKLSHIETLDGRCLDDGGAQVHVWTCSQGAVATMQHWAFDATCNAIKNASNFCLEANPNMGTVHVKKCDSTNGNQAWNIKKPGELTSTQAPVTTVAPTTTEKAAAAVTQAATTKAPAETTKKASTEATASPAPTEEPKATGGDDAAKTGKDGGGEDGSEKKTPATKPEAKEPESPPPPSATATEDIKPMQIKQAKGLCLDAGGKTHMWECAEENENQNWLHDPSTGTIKSTKKECLDATSPTLRAACKPGDTNQQWTVDAYTGQIQSRSGKCLDATSPDNQGSGIALKACDHDSREQQWSVKEKGVKEGPVPAPSPETLDIVIILVIPVLILLLICVMLYIACFKSSSEASSPPVVTPAPSPVKTAARLEPKPNVVKFADPRPSIHPKRDVGLLAFSHPGHDEPWDDLCGSGFLGSSYDLGDGALTLEAQGIKRKFKNAEAAFRALQFWAVGDEFTNLDGEEAMKKKQDLCGHENFEYAGYGNKWKGMFAVLQSKFKSGTKYDKALEQTGDAFLLFHNGSQSKDCDSLIWSDGNDGEGSNWLGMQLMLIRDRRTGWKKWTEFIETSIDTQTGERLQPEDNSTPNSWQDAVRSARTAIVEEISKGQEEERESETPLLPKGGANEETAADAQEPATTEEAPVPEGGVASSS